MIQTKDSAVSATSEQQQSGQAMFKVHACTCQSLDSVAKLSLTTSTLKSLAMMGIDCPRELSDWVTKNRKNCEMFCYMFIYFVRVQLFYVIM